MLSGIEIFKFFVSDHLNIASNCLLRKNLIPCSKYFPIANADLKAIDTATASNSCGILPFITEQNRQVIEIPACQEDFAANAIVPFF